MSTLLEDAPVIVEDIEEDVVDPDEPAKFKHYFLKSDLDRNLFDGAAIVAFCGFVKVGLAHPAADRPVCPACRDVYDELPDEGDDQ